MFDIDNWRIKQLDQLQPWRIYELPRELVTRDGRACPAGMEFRFDHALVNTSQRTAAIHGWDNEDNELVFDTRNQEHREMFRFTGREWRPKPKGPSVPVVPPPPAGGERAWLAEQPGYEAASHILAGNYSTGDQGATRRDANVLRDAARSLTGAYPSVACWLADQALHSYHSWMSQATSGGEGTAMQYEIREELREMRALIDSGGRLRQG